ncbi:MAG: phosphoenolpyruvate synthase [Candidatus Neomarinimicrobiota bacterium]|nr:MAG: phosphoenolpyruvate synthase [Candidatus Neomarinimicrobiota bacterium]
MADFFVGNNDKIDFQDLMGHRVHEILLVASPYDAFILEEDGHLTEQILTEYIGMNFNYAPRVTRVRTGYQAMQIIKKKKFDLVILMLRIEDQDPISLGKKIKDLYPKKPVVLLAFDETELKQLPNNISPNAINRVFIWSGDAIVFPAIIKYIEDRKNAKQDIINGDVRAILLIEDSPRMYSVLLPLIYKEIIYQTKNLMDASLTQSQRLLHLRGRPKILLTPNYETAQKFFKQFKRNMIGVISDVRFPRKGTKYSEAGLDFAKWAREIDPSIPILLQSTQKENEKIADEVNANFLHKNSPTLLNDLRDFMVANFGFGDFVFRLPNKKEVDRASTLEQFVNGIQTIPVNSLLFHANSHHFSNWIAARTEFRLASRLRKIFAHDFKDGELLRNHLIKELNLNIDNSKEKFLDYKSSKVRAQKSNFFRLSGGSLGGKARGLGFARSMITNSGIRRKFKQVDIRVPRCAVIGTNEFDRFMEDNKLWKVALLGKNDKRIVKEFVKSNLSSELMEKLNDFINENKYPLAVRSSSLLEDSQYQPLSGTYETFMLPNNSRSKRKRFHDLVVAIKKVYASTFTGEARSLLETTSHRIQEEKMAILIQEIVGQTYGKDRFYPTFSGVLQSVNYYPVSYMKREEGVAYLALGFGRTIVDGEKCLRISPQYPNIIPQFYSIKSTRQNSQNKFYGLPLKAKDKKKEDLLLYDLKVAEKDGSLKWSGSVISHEDGTIKDNLSINGSRIVSFAPVLKWETIPFSELSKEILSIGKKALGCPVEIEFAVNINKDSKPEFCLLQIKPMVITGLNRSGLVLEKQIKDIFCRSSITLGDGRIESVKDLIIVNQNTFETSKTSEIADEVSRINKKFKNDEKYILVGPGRWGSADPWLGIPVQWNQISQARAIIEVGMDDLPIDPSFGSHFFQNITSLYVAYLTVNPKSKNDQLLLDWIDEDCLVQSNKYTSWYRFKNPFIMTLDGTTGVGEIYQPEEEELVTMDEEESSGI